MMKTDIQIAQEAELMHIKDVAASIGISEEELEFYGKYKAKLSDELWGERKRPQGWKTGSCDSHQSDPGRRRKDHDHSRSG